MPSNALGDLVPTVATTAYMHGHAAVVGEVSIGDRTTVWPSAVLQGCYGAVLVGSDVDVQEGAEVHGSVVGATTLGNRCVVSSLAYLEGCTIGAGCVIGSAAVVLPGAVVGDHAVVAVGTVVGHGVRVPPGALVTGSPARIAQDVWQPVDLTGLPA